MVTYLWVVAIFPEYFFCRAIGSLAAVQLLATSS